MTPDGAARRALAYYEAVPYLLVLETVERDGEWIRRAEHPELPAGAAAAPAAVEPPAGDVEQRRRLLAALWARGATIPLPREPLRGPVPAVY